MIALLVALTYVAEALGFLGIIAGLVMLVLSGPRTEAPDTHWLDGEPITRAEHDHLSRG